ncbi:MotA/TolQ/ExbB proton channel family protein [Ferdinandcohnia quinoae]|uniref:MotA/TolQ/ExbB proton channel family protein n=1 Tax=Fredinandcohnia quinoae TaxID=2918902 RepID=A0AAW5DTS4_9BACI|nr:MotA/TolQ/ExbB proton channel family protein [Fredinandcohnia sp. SECRCQ15]MCH1624047.1 MotA/TolQ/ExbB proton channel family protein [Fredinandcohnia sp. SECRCQ15]
MVEYILKFFMSDERAQTVLSSPLIEFIFIALFLGFSITIFMHFILYSKLRRIRNFIRDTNSLDIAPLNLFKAEYEHNDQQESMKIETYVQNKFSGWRVFNVPVVNLIKMIQMTVSIFILIGVLGTFIGLAMSLGSIDSTGDQLVENVALVLAGIDVAFYTSIAGMGLSLIMTVVTRVTNTEYMLTDIMLKTESKLEGNVPDGIARLITVSETINSSILMLKETNQESLQSIVDSFKGFQEYTVGLQQSAKDLAKFNEGLTENLTSFTVIFNGVKELTDGFDKGVKNLNKNFDQLFSYFDKMDQRNEKMTIAFTETYKKIAELTTSHMETMNHFQQSIIDLKEYFSSIAERQDSIYGAFEKVNGQSEHFIKIMKENNQKFERIFGNDVSSKLSEMITSLREVRNDFKSLGNSIGRLPLALDTINKAQGDYKNLLTYRFDELTQFTHEFNSHLQIHLTNSQAIENYLNETSRSNEQISIKHTKLLNDINRTISQMSDSFNYKENQIESTVNALKDSLSKYAMNLEGTLGDKLEKVSRNIGEYIIDMNEIVKKEFKQIGEITDENQQRGARQLQQTLGGISLEFQQLNRQLQSISQSSMNERVRIGTND